MMKMIRFQKMATIECNQRLLQAGRAEANFTLAVGYFAGETPLDWQLNDQLQNNCKQQPTNNKSVGYFAGEIILPSYICLWINNSMNNYEPIY